MRIVIMGVCVSCLYWPRHMPAPFATWRGYSSHCLACSINKGHWSGIWKQ